MVFTTAFTGRVPAVSGPLKRASVIPRASWQALTTMDELNQKGGRVVKQAADGNKILIQEYDGAVYAVSNKCTHLGLPLQGRIVGKPLAGGCVVCPFHNTAFDLVTGEVKGEWAGSFPNLPFVSKVTDAKPLPTFETRLSGNVIEVNA